MAYLDLTKFYKLYNQASIYFLYHTHNFLVLCNIAELNGGKTDIIFQEKNKII